MARGLSLSFEIEVGNLMATIALLEDNLTADSAAKDATTIILNNTRRRFLMERDPDDKKWPPSEAARRRRGTMKKARSGAIRGGTGTLFDTGTLFRSIQQPAGQDVQMGLFGDTAERRIVAGAYNAQGVEYGHFHQQGTKFLPIRRFLGINPHDVEEFEGVMLLKIARLLGYE